MAFSHSSRLPFLPFLLLLLCLIVFGAEAGKNHSLGRSDFPKGFIFGTASAALQYEGAAKLDGRGSSIWDTFALNAGRIVDGSNADVAVDQYHLYKGDVDLMSYMGMDAYRFSISWPRIFPNGSGTVNQAGVDYYNNLIDTIVAAGIAPFATLYHFDLPQVLQDAYGGWLSPRIIEDYANFAEFCFAEFGDRVKYWITFNEPHGFTITGYDFGVTAPGRCSTHLPNTTCTVGNSSTEPYIVAHHVLLSHAAAFRAYKAKFQTAQGGYVGITLDFMWIEPMSNSSLDAEITQVALDFQIGWFLDPIFTGDYPASMRQKAKERLPVFSKNESEALRGSLDFVGINHYTTYYAMDITNNSLARSILNHDTFIDAGVLPFPEKDGIPIGEQGASSWLYIVPWGIRKAMNYIKNRYGNPRVIITENGIDEANGGNKPLHEALQDQKRIDYHTAYLTNLLAAIKEDGCNVTGYFVWSLLDNWEWTSGYTVRFGLHFVDYNSPGLPRYMKKSANWFQQFLLPYDS